MYCSCRCGHKDKTTASESLCDCSLCDWIWGCFALSFQTAVATCLYVLRVALIRWQPPSLRMHAVMHPATCCGLNATPVARLFCLHAGLATILGTSAAAHVCSLRLSSRALQQARRAYCCRHALISLVPLLSTHVSLTGCCCCCCCLLHANVGLRCYEDRQLDDAQGLQGSVWAVANRGS